MSGAGDPSIQGFTTSFSVQPGDTVHFKIATDATAYTIDIYRIGYYGGAGARHIASLTPSATLPQTQPACLTDDATGLVDCGNWAESASWAVPGTAVSGVYIAKLARTDTSGASQIPFVVRNDASHSDLLFQTSDTTWQAYNTYGGNSLYTGGPGTNPGRGVQGELQPAVHDSGPDTGGRVLQRRVSDGPVAGGERLRRVVHRWRRRRCRAGESVGAAPGVHVGGP